MPLEYTDSCLADAISLFRYYKKLGDGAMAQLDNEQLHAALDPEMNSIAIIVKHMSGNMISRWSGFPDADGESPTRNRDAEFENAPADILRVWEDGWTQVFSALEKLTDADMSRKTVIRGEAHSITQAIHRQLAHYAYHVGQIVFLAKHLRSANWNSLTIPRGRSAEFNARVAGGNASQR